MQSEHNGFQDPRWLSSIKVPPQELLLSCLKCLCELQKSFYLMFSHKNLSTPHREFTIVLWSINITHVPVAGGELQSLQQKREDKVTVLK